MKTASLLAILLILLGGIFVISAGDVEAARLGGGRSFGSKPFMSRPAPAPTMRQQTPMQNRQSMNQATQAGASRGMFGGMGGLFGGLLAGTLLGSLMGGHGMGGGGGFLDIILFGILAFVAYKLFMRFRNRQEPQAASAGPNSFSDRNEPYRPLQRNDMQSGWDALSTPAGSAPDLAQPNPAVPAGFDSQEFLKGAKLAYTRLQQAWDARDLKDIANFATPDFLKQLQQQSDEDPNPGKTELLLVNAQLLGIEAEGNEERAQVFFDVLMRESPEQQTPESVREVWHFVRPLNGSGHWKLDGIQQVQ